MRFSERFGPAHEMDTVTRRAIGSTVRLLCEVRLVVLAFALVLALLEDGVGLLGVFIVALAAPFSFVPALNWDLRGGVYARNGVLLAADLVVTLLTLLPVAGSPLVAIYAAASAALWGLLAGLLLSLIMVVPLGLYQLTAYGDGWRDVVVGAAGSALVVVMAWTGTVVGRRLRRQFLMSAELAAAREHEAVLAERLRLARDLHDTVAGDLAGLALATRGLADRLSREGAAPGTVEMAHGLSDAVGIAHRHTRTVLGELRDETSGLSGPVIELVQRWTDRTGIPASALVGPDIDDAVGPGRARHVRAVVAELLENVRKHAGASLAVVSVSLVGTAVTVRVQDDGRGLTTRAVIDARRQRRDGGYGLRGVEERAALCGGNATWASTPGEGTTALVLLPDEPTSTDEGGRRAPTAGLERLRAPARVRTAEAV